VTKIENEQQLLKELENLPRAVQPGRDLWPDISRRIDEIEAGHRREGWDFRWWPQALAASIALAFVIGILAGRSWISGTTPQPGPRLAWTTDMAGGLATSEIEYQAAFREFVSVGQSNDRLRAETIEFIEQGWSDLRATESAIILALDEHPDNRFLNSKMLDLRQKQLDFLKQIAALEHSSRRITI
jgi:hypothetical protein